MQARDRYLKHTTYSSEQYSQIPVMIGFFHVRTAFKEYSSTMIMPQLSFQKVSLHFRHTVYIPSGKNLPRTADFTPPPFHDPRSEILTGSPSAGPALENMTLYAGSPITSGASFA